MPSEYNRDDQFIMECVPEPTNRIDPLAVLVKKIGSEEVIGRMPKHLCNIVSLGFRVRGNSLRRANCIYLGTYHNEGPVVGGGLKLHCVYILQYAGDTSDRRIGDIANFIRQNVQDDFIYL